MAFECRKVEIDYLHTEPVDRSSINAIREHLRTMNSILKNNLQCNNATRKDILRSGCRYNQSANLEVRLTKEQINLNKV